MAFFSGINIDLLQHQIKQEVESAKLIPDKITLGGSDIVVRTKTDENSEAIVVFKGCFDYFPGCCGMIIGCYFYCRFPKLVTRVVNLILESVQRSQLLYALSNEQEYLEKQLIEAGFEKHIDGSFINGNTGNRISYLSFTR